MIGSSENRISYNGNGIATEFAYNFIIIEKSDIKVLHVAADGTEQLLTKDYYVDMEKSVVLYPGYAPGAEIPEQNRPPILPVGERLVLYREVPITQESALDKHWPFNVIENGLDKLTIICQQIWDRLQRSFYVSESTSTNFDPKVPIEAGKTFRVKDDGTGFEVTEDPGKVIDGATALLKQTTEQAVSANEAATNAQNAANTAEKIATDLGLVDEAVQTAVASATTASDKADVATAKAVIATDKANEANLAANTATLKADAANTSEINAAQSYANADAIATQLTEYLATKETLTAPAVDKTLLIEGAAADAKVVGGIKNDLENITVWDLVNVIPLEALPKCLLNQSETTLSIFKRIIKLSDTGSVTINKDIISINGTVKFKIELAEPIYLTSGEYYYLNFPKVPIEFQINLFDKNDESLAVLYRNNTDFAPFSPSIDMVVHSIRFIIPSDIDISGNLWFCKGTSTRVPSYEPKYTLNVLNKEETQQLISSLNFSDIDGMISNGQMPDEFVKKSDVTLTEIESIESVYGRGTCSNDGDKVTYSTTNDEDSFWVKFKEPITLSADEYYYLYFTGIPYGVVSVLTLLDKNGNAVVENYYPLATWPYIRLNGKDITLHGFRIRCNVTNFSTTFNCCVVRGTSTHVPPYEPKYKKLFLTESEIKLKGKKILTYGDSQTEMNRWQPIVANLTGAEVISYGFGGYPLAYVTIKEGTESFGLSMDYRINELIAKIAETSPDILLIMGGTNDFNYDGVKHPDWNTITVGNNTDTSNTTFKGAIKYIARKILEEYPTLLIVFMSPVDGFVTEAGINMTEPRTNGLGYSLGTFSKAMEEVTGYIGLPFIDVHRCCITVYNSANYISDGTHMNATTGANRVANKVINGLLSILDFN